MNAFISGVSTKAAFLGGTEDGKVRDLWATREIVVVVQSPPTVDDVKNLTTLLSKSAPKPRRQIYELARQGENNTAVYRLKRVEVPA